MRQLKGKPNPVIVISSRHEFGLSHRNCLGLVRRGTVRSSGICHAAALGRRGDTLYEGTEGECQQLNDGILTRSSTLAGVLFLSQKGSSVLFENQHPGGEFNSVELANSLANAFDTDPNAKVLAEVGSPTVAETPQTRRKPAWADLTPKPILRVEVYLRRPRAQQTGSAGIPSSLGA